MVEQTYARKRHCNIVLVAGIDNVVVTDRTAGLCNVLHTAFVCAFNVVTEGEERVRTEGHVSILSKPLFLFLTS